jgi:hypothetical protein
MHCLWNVNNELRGLGGRDSGKPSECSVHLSEPEPMVFAEEPEARA